MAERDKNSKARIGLALAGGGPEGAVYEIGALRALEEAIEGIRFTDLDVYVGVSAGAFIGANLANNLTPAQMCRAIMTPDAHPFVMQTFFAPALGEILRRGLGLPAVLLQLVWDRVLADRGVTSMAPLARLQAALPVAIFDNDPIRRYLHRIYDRPGRTDDFRKLRKPLIVVAADIDSGEAVRFGEPGLDHIPISSAIQASAAFPGLYPPVTIEGRKYVDGVLLKTMHASVALEAGAELVICINPIVPVDTGRAVSEGHLDLKSVSDLGFAFVLSQTMRTLVHSRMSVGLAAYAPRYPDRDIVLFEPQRDDYLMFFTNIFSFRARQFVCELAYESTRRDLLKRYDELAPVFARHGMRLRKNVLLENRELWKGVGINAHATGKAAVAARLDRTLDRLEILLEQLA